jgi:Protein of unknown function (DUF2442)
LCGTIGAVVLRVTAVEAVSDHELRLTFNDGLVRDVDMASDMWGEMGEPLRDPSFFRQVRVDDASRTITWPNGFEPDPDVLHGDYPPAAPGPAGRETARRRPWARLGRMAVPIAALAVVAAATRFAAKIVTSR